MNQLQIFHRVVLDRVTLIAIAGEIDIATSPQLRGYCETHAWPDGGRHLVLDLTEVAFMDSSGIEVLMDAYLRAVRRGATVRVAAPSPPVTRVFDALRLSSHIPVHATVQQALAAALTAPRAGADLAADHRAGRDAGSDRQIMYGRNAPIFHGPHRLSPQHGVACLRCRRRQ